MQCTLDIRLNNAEGVLERVLGRLRQRGFALCGLTVDLSDDSCTYFVQAKVESSRPMERAVKQLDKLVDVQSVRFHHHMEVVSGNGYLQREEEPEFRVCASV